MTNKAPWSSIFWPHQEKFTYDEAMMFFSFHDVDEVYS